MTYPSSSPKVRFVKARYTNGDTGIISRSKR